MSRHGARDLQIVVEPDADIESEAVPEREGESLGVEREAVA